MAESGQASASLTPLSRALHRLLLPWSQHPPRAAWASAPGRADGSCPRMLTSLLLGATESAGSTYKSVRLLRGRGGHDGRRAPRGHPAGLLVLASAEGRFRSRGRCWQASFPDRTLKQRRREGPPLRPRPGRGVWPRGGPARGHPIIGMASRTAPATPRSPPARLSLHIFTS